MTPKKKIDQVETDTSTLPEGERCLTCLAREVCPLYLAALGMDDLAEEAKINLLTTILGTDDDLYNVDGEKPTKPVQPVNPAIPREESIRTYFDPLLRTEERADLFGERHLFHRFRDDIGRHLLLRFENNYGLHMINNGNPPNNYSMGVIGFYGHLIGQPDNIELWQAVDFPPHYHITKDQYNQAICRIAITVPYLPPLAATAKFLGEIHPDLITLSKKEDKNE